MDGLNPNLDRFEKRADGWDKNPDRVLRANRIASVIVEAGFVPPGARVMDLGSGTGLLTMQLQAHAGYLTAVDISPRMLNALEEKCAVGGVENVETVAWDVECGELPGSEYQLIVSSMTLHHIRKIEALLCACASSLMDGGRLVIADLDRDASGFHRDEAGVVHPGFDRAALAELFKLAGFGDVAAQTAWTVSKEVAGVGLKSFSIFVMSGRKQRAGVHSRLPGGSCEANRCKAIGR